MKTILSLILCTAISSGNAFAQSQFTALDTTFGNRGIVRTDTGTTKLQQAKVVAMQDGRVLVAGSYYHYDPNFDIETELRIMRFLQNGQPDSSLNGNGILSYPTLRLNTVVALQVRADGKIVLTGSKGRIERFLPDGTPDVSLNDSGFVTLDFFGPYDVLAGAVLQPDNKLVVCGYVSQQYILTMRLLEDGDADLGFGFNGIQTTSVDSVRNVVGTGISLQPDGKIVVCASAHEDSTTKMLVIRFMPDGGLDPTFNASGYRKIAFDGFKYVSADQIIVQQDGKVLLNGYAYKQMAGQPKSYYSLARLTANGALDAGFGSGGRMTLNDTLDITQPFFERSRLAVQADGRILLASTDKSKPFNRRYLLRRFLANGTPDYNFGNSGSIITDIGVGHDVPTDVALQPDGKIVVVGSSDIDLAWPQSIGNTPAIVRYRPDVTLDVRTISGRSLSAILYPNPVRDDLNLLLQAAVAGTVTIRLTSITGQLLSTWSRNATIGQNNYDLPVPASIESGNYLLQITSGNAKTILRFLKN